MSTNPLPTDPQDPLSVAYGGIVECFLADEVLKEYHDSGKIFFDFLSPQESPTLTNPAIPAKDMPRMSLLHESAEWVPSNTCTGLLTYTINVRIAGCHTRSPMIQPLVFYTMRAIRRLSSYLNVRMFNGNPLRTVTGAASATFEHDDERMVWMVTLPISVQVYI